MTYAVDFRIGFWTQLSGAWTANNWTINCRLWRLLGCWFRCDPVIEFSWWWHVCTFDWAITYLISSGGCLARHISTCRYHAVFSLDVRKRPRIAGKLKILDAGISIGCRHQVVVNRALKVARANVLNTLPTSQLYPWWPWQALYH